MKRRRVTCRSELADQESTALLPDQCSQCQSLPVRPGLRRFCCRPVPPGDGPYRDIRALTEHPPFRKHGHRRAHVMAHGPCPKPHRTGSRRPQSTAAGRTAMTSIVSKLYRSCPDLRFRYVVGQPRRMTLVGACSGRFRTMRVPAAPCSVREQREYEPGERDCDRRFFSA